MGGSGGRTEEGDSPIGQAGPLWNRTCALPGRTWAPGVPSSFLAVSLLLDRGVGTQHSGAMSPGANVYHRPQQEEVIE